MACTFMAALSFAQTKVSIDSVSNHIGEHVAICSEVFGVKSTDKVTFINVGASYPHSPLTLVIFAKDLVNFTDSPEKLYNHRAICIKGRLKEYKGKAEIVVSKPDEIELENKN